MIMGSRIKGKELTMAQPAKARHMTARGNTVISVMIVEDDPGTRARFAAAVGADSRTRLAYAAANGADALANLESVCPDVLLVDLGLPDMHGAEVIRHATRVLPECDAMVITAFADESSVFASVEAGATGYILKDSADMELVERILELRAGGAPMSPGIARMVLNRMRSPGAGRTRAAAESRSGLTDREIDVLGLIARGYTYAEIAAQLNISPHTVTSHIKNSYRKLAARSGAEAVTRAAALGVLPRVTSLRNFEK